jgi:phosphoribosylanthranilate isomerase
MVIQFSSLLFICRVNSYKASYRHCSVDTSNYIMDKTQHKVKEIIIIVTNKHRYHKMCISVIIFDTIQFIICSRNASRFSPY